ncbi:transcriptional regulator NrdR [Patescibacteria group bacterium]|nr:transcriptional regulator NrdR [Patescibacteria group bacterium]
MQCPACAHEATKVLDSRLSEQDNTVKRRRECEKCFFRFSTREETEILNITVIKRDGRHEAYSREKLSAGFHKALEKRPITNQELRILISNIERDMYGLNKVEIKASQIGDIAMRHLKKLDKVAYIRFASVYREFKDVNTFYEELNKLIGKRKTYVKRTKQKRAAKKSKRIKR